MQSQVMCSGAMQNDVEPWESYVLSSRVKQSDDRVIYSLVELSRAMVMLCRVQLSEVEPWQSYVESSRVKQSHGRVMQNQVE